MSFFRYSLPRPGARPDLRPRLRSGAFLLLILTFLAAGCGGGDASPPARAQEGGPGRRAEPPVPVATAAAEKGTIASYYEATATLEPEKEAQVLARLAGVVEKILCEEGDSVSEGQELLRIDADEYLYRLRQAEAARKEVESRFQRLQNMLDQNLVSQEEFETTRSELERAKADEGLAQVELGYTRVTAPFAGEVVQRLVDPGQTVSNGTPLFLLADFQPLLARIHVPAREFRSLEVDQPVELVLDSDGTRLQGRIDLVSPVVDPETGTIKVTVKVPTYPQGVRPGDFAQVQVVTERRQDRVLVPKEAVVSDKGEEVVFVARDGAAERRAVQVGFRDDRNVEIVDGVEAGEPVVVKGQRSLRHGQPLRVLEGPGAGQEPAEAGAGRRPEKASS